MSKYENFMDKTGKNNKVFTSFHGPFLNTDSLVVEYEDILESPEMVLLLLFISNNIDLSDSYDMSEVMNLKKLNEINNWYIKRKHQSLFDNFKMTDKLRMQLENSTDEINVTNFSEKLVNNNLKDLQYAIDTATHLNFYDTLRSFSSLSMLKKIIIFSKYDKEITEKIWERMSDDFDKKVIFSHGISFKEVLNKYNISSNSTFVLSDINYITELYETGKLKYSSILVPSNLGYNFKTEDELIIPIDKYMEDQLFKLNFFNNFYK